MGNCKSYSPIVIWFVVEMVIFTIGHSTRTAEQFIELLKVNKITTLVDIRTIPKSRHNPQFNLEDLKQSLENGGIKYIHLIELGGLRHLKKDSINTAWKNLSFRGFADYMQTSEFAAGIDRLLDLTTRDQVAIMCAEAVPWRCHRSLIADALLVRNVAVRDILSEKSIQPHKLTPWAKVNGKEITYPTDPEETVEAPK